MKVLFIPSVLKSKAIVWYRTIIPLKSLRKEGYNAKMITKFYKEYDGSVKFDMFDWADVIVTGRFFYDDAFLDTFKKGYDKFDGLKVYDTDDMCWDIPYKKIRKEYKKTEEFTNRLMEDADVMTCTNDYLKEQLEKKVPGANVEVIPNLVEFNNWGDYDKKEHDSIRIGYACGGTHQDEIDFLHNVLPEIKERYGDKVETILISPYSKEKKYKNVWDHVYNHIPFNNFPEYMAGIGLDIGLAPLVNKDEFNLSKSNIKFTNYSMTKTASVLEDNSIYRDIDNACFAGNKDEWIDKISYLVENTKERKKMAENAYKEVWDNYSMNSQGHLWKEIIKKYNLKFSK